MKNGHAASTESQTNMFRFVIWLVLFTVLFGMAVREFVDISDSVKYTEAETAIQGYAASVVSVHRDWILQGRPNNVTVRGVNANGQAQGKWIFVMNSFGWPIHIAGSKSKEPCKVLWNALQKSERLSFSGELLNFRLNQLDAQRPDQMGNNRTDDSRRNISVCRNTIAEQIRFTYRFDTGKVELRP